MPEPKCRLAEYEQMDPRDLADELLRLREEIGHRTLSAHQLASSKTAAKNREQSRLAQAAHDYLDVQHVLRHLPRATEVSSGDGTH